MRSSSIFLSASLLLVGSGMAQGEKSPGEPVKRAPVKAAAAKPAGGERPKDAAGLFAAFAKMPGLEARYTEKKYLSLLVVPLESRGRLYFLQPGYLSRVVEAPEKSTLVITPSQLRMAGRDGAEVIDLHQSDRLKLFVTSLVRVFHGEREAIERHFRAEYTLLKKKDEQGWRLVLTPRGKPLSQMIKSLTLEGSGLVVTEFEVAEPNGDRTVTSVVDANPRRVFDKGEKAKIFGIDPITKGEPGKQAPSKQAPSEKAPSKQAPSEKAPSKQAPSEKAPSKQAPSEKAPSKQAP